MSTIGQSRGPLPAGGANARYGPATNSQKPCNQWRTKGKCKFGQKCQFRHAENEKGILQKDQGKTTATGTDGSGRRPSVAVEESTTVPVVYDVSNFPVKAIICRDWQSGKRCTYGGKCRFSHPTKIISPKQSNVASSSAQEQTDDSQGKSIGIKDIRKEIIERANDLKKERLERQKAVQEAAEQNRKDEEARRNREREILERQKAEQEAAEQRRKADEEARQAEERMAKERAEREERERRAAEARKRKEEAVRRKKEENLRRQEAAKRKREAELEAKRRDEERLAREQAEREAARKEHLEQIKALREKEAAAVEQYVVSEASLITCSAGMEIQHVVTGFELCRITINNLPTDIRRDEIADIFAQQGVDMSDFYILEVRPYSNKFQATVLANADQGKAIAVGLEGIEFRDETLSFEVSENASWGTMGATAQTAPFMTVSWWLPSETIVAAYNSMDKAREQVRKLNSKRWNNRRIRAVMNERPNGAAARFFNPQSIKIFGFQPGTEVNYELHELVDSFDVRVIKSAKYSPTDMFSIVRYHMDACVGAQMDTYEVINDENQCDGEAKIKVQFNNWEDAKQAYDTMDKKRLAGNNYPPLRCWLPKPLQYSIKIPRQQYEAQKRQWDELSEKRADRNAHVQTRIGDRGDVFIRVIGQDKKAAGSLKVRVEGMVAGEKLDSTTYWHPSFTTARGKALFSRIFDSKKVYIRSDFKTRSLRVYGEQDGIEDAKEMIKEEVDRLAKMETTRPLDQGCVRGFMREGLGRLKELLGEENVTVNVASVPYRVTVKGGIEATHHLQRIMDECRMRNPVDDVLPGDTEKEICPICYDEVSNPEQLGCGHTYCSGCLQHFLTSAADTKIFPLVCMGNEAQCKVPIAIPSIRRFLPTNAFQNLVEATFTSYLDQHPLELKYCTTPDCKQIYRRCSNKTQLQCPSCYSTICPKCDQEAHEGMTCEERRIQQDPAEQERLNDELARTSGFKKCPQCNILIEKTEGCNHMTCKCGAHICWICLGLFTPATIYPHLNAAHGGIYEMLPAGANGENQDENNFIAFQIQEIQRLERMREERERLARMQLEERQRVERLRQEADQQHQRERQRMNAVFVAREVEEAAAAARRVQQMRQIEHQQRQRAAAVEAAQRDQRMRELEQQQRQRAAAVEAAQRDQRMRELEQQQRQRAAAVEAAQRDQRMRELEQQQRQRAAAVEAAQRDQRMRELEQQQRQRAIAERRRREETERNWCVVM